jgi:hypothetical protein
VTLFKRNAERYTKLDENKSENMRKLFNTRISPINGIVGQNER